MFSPLFYSRPAFHFHSHNYYSLTYIWLAPMLSRQDTMISLFLSYFRDTTRPPATFFAFNLILAAILTL